MQTLGSHSFSAIPASSTCFTNAHSHSPPARPPSEDAEGRDGVPSEELRPLAGSGVGGQCQELKCSESCAEGRWALGEQTLGFFGGQRL